MNIATTVGDALAFEEIDFQILRRVPADSPADTARKAGITPERLAKAVLLKDAHGYLLTVMPATHVLDLDALRKELHRQLTLAEDEDLDDLFCDCVVGAVPPIGPWYRVPTVVEASLKEQPDIYFEAGDQRSLVHVTETSFEKLLHGAEYLNFSHHA
jgi:Ala-tRNA(Pro) deacylase